MHNLNVFVSQCNIKRRLRAAKVISVSVSQKNSKGITYILDDSEPSNSLKSGSLVPACNVHMSEGNAGDR